MCEKFDDAAFRSSGRQADIHALRRDAAQQSTNDDDDAQEAAAARDGIVYIKLSGGNIGTLVNGAGLAMNTVDALADAGGRAANFLDTGGKATRETVKRSFEIILTDPRVKVRTYIRACFFLGLPPSPPETCPRRELAFVPKIQSNSPADTCAVHFGQHLWRPDAGRHDR